MDTSHWSDAIEPVEKVDENEWWNKIRQLREGSQQELVVKRNFGRDGQNILADMAQRQGLYLSFDAFFRISNLHLEADKFHFHYPVFNLGEDSNVYNKGKTIVFSKVPLPDYRADLDERHGSTQQEGCLMRLRRRVESLLAKAKSNSNDSASTSTLTTRQSRPSTSSSVTESTKDIDKERLSSELRDIQNSRKMMPSARSMQSFRDKLPAFKMREEFLKAVAANQVLVISGETGCGKTTQLPQFILEEEIDNLRGADCSIICTQPRRISAISVAARVASERGEELGDTVGYQIRLESKRSAQTRLLFCTTGVLLRRSVQEPDLVGLDDISDGFDDSQHAPARQHGDGLLRVNPANLDEVEDGAAGLNDSAREEDDDSAREEAL
ncbi:hypothetical protein OsI_34001 [Oryza sativa Indica Group]|uniref:Helicase ATP-binding domain-containing protein n=1 Tax=Oryza sativa subsp. indica TaxID=39946 RepID=B8BHF4_ORYSI|nr:hypothetical protein OsI_34001 [Oryza sativa Indica Group]